MLLFSFEHGLPACAMGGRIYDVAQAYAEYLRRGVEPITTQPRVPELNVPAIKRPELTKSLIRFAFTCAILSNKAHNQ